MTPGSCSPRTTSTIRAAVGRLASGRPPTPCSITAISRTATLGSSSWLRPGNSGRYRLARRPRLDRAPVVHPRLAGRGPPHHRKDRRAGRGARARRDIVPAGDRRGAGAGPYHRPGRNGRGDLTDREICRPAPRSRSSPRVAEAAYATKAERRVGAEAGPAVRLSFHSPPRNGTGVCRRRGLSALASYLFPGELVKLIPSRPSMHTGRVGTSADDDAGAWFGEAPRGGRRRPCR